MHTHKHRQTHAHTYKRPNTQAHTRAHTHARIHTHAHMHMHAHVERVMGFAIFSVSLATLPHFLVWSAHPECQITRYLKICTMSQSQEQSSGFPASLVWDDSFSAYNKTQNMSHVSLGLCCVVPALLFYVVMEPGICHTAYLYNTSYHI
jgi:hypothetical protein